MAIKNGMLCLMKVKGIMPKLKYGVLEPVLTICYEGLLRIHSLYHMALKDLSCRVDALLSSSYLETLLMLG